MVMRKFGGPSITSWGQKYNSEQSVRFPNWSLYHRCLTQTKKISASDNEEASVLRSCQPRYLECIQHDTMAKQTGCVSEYKGT